MQNIVTVEFRTENEAHLALEELKKEQETYGYKIMQMGLVKKENGVDTPIAGFDLKEGKGKAGKVSAGGIVGGIIGAISGPVGLAIGLGVGAGVGASASKSATKKLKLKNMGLMKQAVSKMPDDAVLLVALIDEEEEIVFDSRVKKLNKYRTKINHYSVDELELEIKAAERAAKEAEKEAEAKPEQDMKKMKELAKENKKASKRLN